MRIKFDKSYCAFSECETYKRGRCLIAMSGESCMTLSDFMREQFPCKYAEYQNWRTTIIKVENELEQFFRYMITKINDNFPEKGLSFVGMDKNELQEIMNKYIKREDNISVANIAFMIWFNQRD